eukprot:403340883
MRLFSQSTTEINDQKKDESLYDQQKKLYDSIKDQLTEVEMLDKDSKPKKPISKHISDVKKIDFILDADRTVMDFSGEIAAMQKHEQIFTKPRLSQIVNSIYVPKYKVKCFSSYLYGGEDAQNINQYNYSINYNTLFNDENRSRDEVILGIESSFDNSAASLVNSFGEVKAEKQIDMWDQWEELDGIDPQVASERHSINLPLAIQSVMDQYKLTKGDKRLRSIAVTVGPGQEKSLNVGIQLAQILGRELDVPVIPVNHIEGHVLTSRFAQENEHSNSNLPLIKFPYVSVLTTGKHTEIVLNRGVGLHTILGITIDIAVGDVLDKASNLIRRFSNVLKNKEDRNKFIQEHNINNPHDQIPADFYDFIDKDDIHRGNFIELMARYGKQADYVFPLGFKIEPNADMTYTGVRTAIISSFYERPKDQETRVPIYERDFKNFNFKDLCDYAFSIQFVVLKQVKNKTKVALDWLYYKGIDINALNLAGGVSCNGMMRDMFGELAKNYNNLPLTYSPKKLCTDNASMISWMVNGYKKIPLGNYVEGLTNVKGSATGERVATRNTNEQIIQSMARKRKTYYYCKNFSFKQVNNLFAYQVKDPSVLTTEQRISRLYKGTMRKLLAQHVFTVKRTNVDRFYEEQYKARKDFDKILNSKDETEISIMLEKYELYIEQQFEQYAAMHDSREHSNLWGKHLVYTDTALQTDHFGYYKPVLLSGEPTTVHFHEQYPHMVGAWVYDNQFTDENFNYEDLEAQYLRKQKTTTTDPQTVKQQLDQHHNV